MKNILLLLSTVLIFVGCSTNNNGIVTVVPIAPTNLTGTVISTTQVNLSWTDNATNEDGYKIERKSGSGSYSVVGSMGVNLTTFSDLGLTPNTTYTYRVYAYNSAGNSIQYSNEVSVTTTSVPTLTTTSISSISATSSISGGEITGDGGSNISERGVVWSTSTNPNVTLSTKTIDGSGTGVFTSNISGLNPNTTYYVRAYATNSEGTGYGNEISFTTSNIDITSGLVAYWPFNGNANDESGNGNNGTINGAVDLTTDRNGNLNSAYSFSGGTITVPYSNTIGVQQNITISVWLLMNGGGCNPRVLEINSIYDQCGGYSLATNGTSNSSRTFHTANFGDCSNGVGTGSSPSLNALEWHHVVYSVDGSNGVGKMYLDGLMVYSYNGTSFSSINYNNNPLTIGNINPGRCDWWGGNLDEIRIYNRVLSDSEVQYLYSH